MQGLLIIGINNIQKIIIGIRQIPIVNIFLDLPFLYLYLFICWSYLVKNSINYYNKRKSALTSISELEELIRENTAIIKGYNFEINKIDKLQMNKLKKTGNCMGKSEKKIREYISSTLDIVSSLYLTLLIIVLIEPIEIKQYYLFISHLILNTFFVYNLLFPIKGLTTKFDKIAPEFNQVLEKIIQTDESISKIKH